MSKYEIVSDNWGKQIVKFTDNHVTIDVFDSIESANDCVERLNNGTWFE